MTLRNKIQKFTARIAAPALLSALVLTNVAMAQDSHSHATAKDQTAPTQEQLNQANALIKIVKDSTARFQDVNVAKSEGYALQFGCVSGDSGGQWDCTT